MVRRSKDGRTFRRRSGELGGRLDRLEARVERLEKEAGLAREDESGSIQCSCCDDIIGCLDDCVTDVKELRKRVKDARS